MTDDEQEQVLMAIHATAEILGYEVKPNAAVVMLGDLSGYSFNSVMSALSRCRKELSGKLTLVSIIDRISGADGRPSANEAWSYALRSMDESETVVINDDISKALSVATPIYNAGDKIGARMAFKDAYDRCVMEARERGDSPNWWASLGHDKNRREPVIRDAIEKGYLGIESLPVPELPAPKNDKNLLPPEEVAKRIRALLESVGGKPKKHPARVDSVKRKNELLAQAALLIKK